MVTALQVETVADLIAVLKDLPQDYKIGAGWDSGVSLFESLEVCHDVKAVCLEAGEYGSLSFQLWD